MGYLTVSQLNEMHVNPEKIFHVPNCKCWRGSHPAGWWPAPSRLAWAPDTPPLTRLWHEPNPASAPSESAPPLPPRSFPAALVPRDARLLSRSSPVALVPRRARPRLETTWSTLRPGCRFHFQICLLLSPFNSLTGAGVSWALLLMFERHNYLLPPEFLRWPLLIDVLVVVCCLLSYLSRSSSGA